MNALTQADVFAEDQLFATLDPTVRIIDPRTRPPILLSDTVGFIDKLPHSLVASFTSTLQEVLEADILLHVVDISEDTYEQQIEVTQKVLEQIGAGDKPGFLVFNKADLLKERFLPKLIKRKYIDSLVVSSFNPEDMRRLREAIFEYFERDMVEIELVIPYKNTWLQSQVHEHSKVIKKEFLEEGAMFQVKIMRSTANWLRLFETQDVKVL